MLDVRSKDRIGNRAGASLPVVDPLCRLVPLRPRRFTTQDSSSRGHPRERTKPNDPRVSLHLLALQPHHEVVFCPTLGVI